MPSFELGEGLTVKIVVIKINFAMGDDEGRAAPPVGKFWDEEVGEANSIFIRSSSFAFPIPSNIPIDVDRT